MNVKITSCLKLSGNAEWNPGPYEIMRSVQGSFNQGNVVLFGETTGKKCVCNILLLVRVGNICNWKSVDLE